MKIHFSELNYETLYPLTVKLDNGNIYDGRFTDLRVTGPASPPAYMPMMFGTVATGNHAKSKALYWSTTWVR